MAVIYEYKFSTSTLADPSGSLNFTSAQTFRGGYKLRVVRASISKSIANVYDATEAGLSSSLSNNQFAITITDGVTPETSIVTLPTGIYTIELINLAVISALKSAGWIEADETEDFPLYFSYNLATTKAYMIITNANLAAAYAGYEMTVNFTAYPNFKYLLGFTGNTYTEGTHVAETAAALDYFGNNVEVSLYNFGPLAWRTGSSGVSRNNVVCIIPLGGGSENEYFIEMESQPEIHSTPDNIITTLKVDFAGDRADTNRRKILIMEGNASLIFSVEPIGGAK